MILLNVHIQSDKKKGNIFDDRICTIIWLAYVQTKTSLFFLSGSICWALFDHLQRSVFQSTLLMSYYLLQSWSRKQYGVYFRLYFF